MVISFLLEVRTIKRKRMEGREMDAKAEVFGEDKKNRSFQPKRLFPVMILSFQFKLLFMTAILTENHEVNANFIFGKINNDFSTRQKLC